MKLLHFWNLNRLSVCKALATGLVLGVVWGTHAPSHAQTAATEEITYNGHIAAIINENCVVCHREGGIAPMQFTSYEQVRPWAPIIGYRVERREMPPHAYDQHIGIQDLSPRILRASCMSLGMMVTRLAWMAHRLVSSKRPTM